MVVSCGIAIGAQQQSSDSLITVLPRPCELRASKQAPRTALTGTSLERQRIKRQACQLTARACLSSQWLDAGWFAPAGSDSLHAQAESSRGIKRKAERSEIAYNDDLPLGLVRHHKSQRRQTDAGLPTLRGFAPLESLRFGMPPPAAALMAPGLQHRRRLCVKQLRRRALPVSAAAASAVLGDALELEDMSEAELQALRGPPGGAALALPASAAAGALALTTASASVKPPKTPAGPLAAGGDAGLEATIGSRTKAARTAPRTHSGPGGERVGGDDSAVVQLNFGTNAEGQKGATAGSERKQGAAPGGSGPWPGGARAVEPGLAGLANGGAGDHPGGGVPTQGAGQALPDAALAFRFGAAAAARPAPAPATQALAQQPAPPQFALGLGSGVAQALAAAPMAGAAGGRAQGGGSPAGLTMGAPAQGLFGAGAPAPGLPAVAAPQAAGFGMPGAGPLAPAVGAFTFGGAPATAQAPQPSAFGGQAGGFGAGASAAFGQPPLQVCPQRMTKGPWCLCCTRACKARRADVGQLRVSGPGGGWGGRHLWFALITRACTAGGAWAGACWEHGAGGLHHGRGRPAESRAPCGESQAPGAQMTMDVHAVCTDAGWRI